MIHPDDVVAWIAQVRQQPEAAPRIIEALAARLMELDKQNEALRDELVRLSRTRKPAADGAQVAALTRRVQALERQLTLGIQVGAEDIPRSLLVITLDGRGARIPVSAVEFSQQEDAPTFVSGHLRPRYALVASDTDELLLFSDKGRAMRLVVESIDPAEVPVHYLSLLPQLALELDEAIGVIVPFPPKFEQLTLITRKGFARSFRRAEVDSLLERNLPLHSSPVQGDYPAVALFGDGRGELLIATRIGKGVRFPERMVSVQPKPAIKLDRGDVVVGGAVVEDETSLALIGSDGAAVRREMAGFGAHPTPGNRGKILTRISELVAIAPVEADDVLWLLTASGQLRVIASDNVPSGPGASSGRIVTKLGEDRVVALVTHKGA